MKKNKFTKDNDDLLETIFENKILFITIVIVFLTLSVIYSFKNRKDFIETKTQVTINYPSLDYFLVNRQIFNKVVNSEEKNNDYVFLVEKDYEKFIYDFVSFLLSTSSTISFLNDRANAHYLAVFNKLNIDIMDYFKKNKFEKLANPVDPKEKYSTIISLTHPSELYVNNFLTEYINVIKKKTINEFLEAKLNEINKLKNFSQITNQTLNSEIKKLEYLEKIWLDFSFEAIGQISSVPLKDTSHLMRNILLSFIFSLLLFFLIIIFKQFYKKILNK
jgi:LPS O-antigen subunit length determinant protein (WzzB/FepE family)